MRHRPPPRGAAARDERQPLHPPRRRRGPRRAAVRADRASLSDDPNRFKFEGNEHYLKTRRGDAPPVPRAARGVRQHAARSPSGPTSRSSSASRSCPRSRCPTGSRATRRGGLPTCATSPSRARAERYGDAAARRGGRAPRLRARRHRDMGFSAYFLVVWDLIRYARESRHPGRARAGVAPPGAASPTACASSTSTRSGTTCSSSGSSTRAASRCPTSTWTSTSATAAR